MRRRIIIHNHLPHRTRDVYRRMTLEHYDETPSLEQQEAEKKKLNDAAKKTRGKDEAQKPPPSKEEEEEAKKQLKEKRMRFLEGRDAKDHWYKIKQVGSYDIFEGAGVNGGQWAAKERPGFGKGRREVKLFKSRAQAEEHAELSSDR